MSLLYGALWAAPPRVGSSEGVEGLLQGEETFGWVTGSQPRLDLSVWGRESTVRGERCRVALWGSHWSGLGKRAQRENTLWEIRRLLEEEPECRRAFPWEDTGGEASSHC